MAEQKLRRWGFNPDRRCALPTVCKQLLIKTPGFRNDLFPGLDFRDTLHGLHAFLQRTLYEPFSRMAISGQIQKILDQRLTELGLHRIMRDVTTGKSFRVQKSLFKDVGMTGEDRIHWIFLVPHVLGHRALCLPENLREPVLTAFATAQTMVIASRGSRAYNVAELQLTFDRGFITLFSCMERIYQINHERIYASKMAKHLRNPDKNKKPKKFEIKNR